MTTPHDTHSANDMSRALRWALDAGGDSATAAADWLATDIDPNAPSAVALVTASDVAIDQLEAAKSAYKTMRVVGETAADRRMGGRLYLAAIAAALVHHERRISGQSDRALRNGLKAMVDDPEAAPALRELAARALVRL